LSDLHVPLRPSRALALAVLAGHVTAAACLWITLPAPGAMLAIAGLALSAFAFFRTWSFGPTGLILHRDGRLHRVDAAGEVREVELEHAAVPAWWFVALVLRESSGRRSSVVLFPDSTDRAALRRLRASLPRCHARAVAAPPPAAR
jgi:hypothetical protein